MKPILAGCAISLAILVLIGLLAVAANRFGASRAERIIAAERAAQDTDESIAKAFNKYDAWPKVPPGETIYDSYDAWAARIAGHRYWRTKPTPEQLERLLAMLTDEGADAWVMLDEDGNSYVFDAPRPPGARRLLIEVDGTDRKQAMRTVKKRLDEEAGRKDKALARKAYAEKFGNPSKE